MSGTPIFDGLVSEYSGDFRRRLQIGLMVAEFLQELKRLRIIVDATRLGAGART